ncbi:MAG: hypothetical protein ACR2RE_29350 [Geminicoccaceae bacterium]
MATFLSLIDRLESDLGSRAGNLLDTEIKEAINQAIEDYEEDRYSFNEDTTDFPTVALQAEYDLDTVAPNVLTIDQGQYLLAGHLYRLVRQTYEWYVEALVNQTAQTGPSNFYIVYGRKLFLYPQPDQITTVTLSGVHRELNVPLTADGDENGWTNDARQMIRYAAAMDLYANRLKDPVAAQAMGILFDRQRKILLNKSERLRMKGQITPFRQF